MKLLAISLWVGIATALEIPRAVKEFGVELPECARHCIEPVLIELGHSNTSFTDLGPSLCHDIPSMVRISGCLQSKCSLEDHNVAWPFQKELCRNEPTPSRAAYIRNLTIVMAVIATIFLLFRYYSRMFVVRHFWWDDGNMLVTAACLLVVAVVMIWSSTIGLGLHAWEVEPRNIIINAKIFFIMKLFYVFVQVLVKVSILLCYLRSLPVDWIQKATWILIYCTLAHGVAFSFAIIFQCSPVSLLWDKTLTGKCIELRDVIFPGAIFSMLEDVAILVLPIPCLAKLNVGKGKRFSLIAIFSVGFIATLISILRAKPTWHYRDTLDQTWDTIDLLAWSEAEIAVACICVCLPSMKPVLNKHFPRYFSAAATFRSLDNPSKQKASDRTDRWLDAVVERGLGKSDPSHSTQSSEQKDTEALSPAIELPGSTSALQSPPPVVHTTSKGSIQVQSLTRVRELEVYRADGIETESIIHGLSAPPVRPRRSSKPPALPKLTFLRDEDSESD